MDSQNQPAPDRRTLTFSQAEGAEAIPSQLALRQISRPLAVQLWDILYSSIVGDMRMYNKSYSLGVMWTNVLIEYHMEVLGQFSSTFSDEFVTWRDRLQKLFSDGNYIKILELVQFVIRSPHKPEGIVKQFAAALSRHQAAYFIDGDTIYPKASLEEGVALVDALNALRQSEYGGARSHLSAASRLLGSGDYSGSVRESISAVESIAHVLEPNATKLGAALSKLEGSGRIHGGLKVAFAALYGYASDAEGIRHALVFDSKAEVDEADALFMIGACASFVTFVIRKGELSAGPR